MRWTGATFLMLGLSASVFGIVRWNSAHKRSYSAGEIFNWEHIVLEDSIQTIEAANEAEIWWIGHFCSNDSRFGYNSTTGG